MSGEGMRGPGGLVLHEAGVDPGRLDFSGGPEDWVHLPAMGLRDFVDEHLVGDGAARICVFLDAPRRIDTRVAAALACARDLLTRGQRVIVVDGDDQSPELSGWAGRLETEGWVDVVRYGVSPVAASVPLPWGPGEGRVMGVGSYAPVRAEAGEARTLAARLLAETDTVLICASTGDRGAYWAELEARRVVCWDRARADAAETALLVRDAADLGAGIDAALAFGTAVPVADEPYVEDVEPPRHSSPIFRRLALTLAVLVVVLGSWFLGQTLRRDTAPVELPPVVDATGNPSDPREQPGDSAATGTLGVAAVESDSIDAVVPIDEVVDGVANEDAATGEAATEASASPSEPEPDAADDAVDWTRPVEDGAYCLHVYSLADSAMADEELHRMQRRHVAGMVRRWRDEDGKLWYRIYAGSFASLAEARAAMPDLYERLDTDWALPRRTARLR